jgi:TetR/AcrR family transcriptional regulator of autoinduction and epiphytic fitness
MRSIAIQPTPEDVRRAADLDGDVTGDVAVDEDGRRLRRERNRDAVVEALLELFQHGELQPSANLIAERAGLSPRSLFRYFDDIDDLTRAAIQRQQRRVWPLALTDVRLDAPLDARVAALAQARVRLYDAIGNVGEVARLRAPFQPIVAQELTRGRSLLRRQLRELFTPELDALGTVHATGMLAALDVLCSYESYRLMRVDQSMTKAKVTATLVEAISRLLAPSED